MIFIERLRGWKHYTLKHTTKEKRGHATAEEVGQQWNVWLQCLLSRLLTFNLSLDFSIAMVPVVDLLLCSLQAHITF